MKRYIFLLPVFCSLFTYSQDKIVKFDNSIIESKVLEVSDTAIKYKRSDNPDGPVYSISRKQLAVIIFQNGTVEVMNSKAPSSSSSYDEYRIRKREERRELRPYRNIIGVDVFGMIPGVNSFNANYGISSISVLYERRNKKGFMAHQVSGRVLYIPDSRGETKTAGSFYLAYHPKIFFNKHKYVRVFGGTEVALGFVRNYNYSYAYDPYYGYYYYNPQNMGYFHAAPHFGINFTPTDRLVAIFDFGVGFQSTYDKRGIYESSVYWKIGAALGGMF